MRLRHVSLFAAVALVFGFSSMASAQSQAAGTSKAAWTQQAPDLATAQSYTYKHYDDAGSTGTSLTSATCANQTPVVSGVFDCVAPFPAFTPGTHTIAVTAASVAGESLKSAPLSFQFVVVPSAPTNVRIIALLHDMQRRAARG